MKTEDYSNEQQGDLDRAKKIEERKAQTEKRLSQIIAIEKEGLTEWRSKGYPEVETLSDIMNLKKRLTGEQINFLLAWIPKIDNSVGSQERLVRALILADKPFDGSVLTKLFDDPNSSFYLKWAIGNTIASAKVLNIAQWLRAKFESISLGKEKEMLVYALGQYLDTEEARSYLVKIFDYYPLHAAETLAKIGGREDLDFLVNMLARYKGQGRGSINKSIKKLEKKLLK